jgi:hypothetical protein
MDIPSINPILCDFITPGENNTASKNLPSKKSTPKDVQAQFGEYKIFAKK